MDRDLEDPEQQTLYVESKQLESPICNEVWMSGENIRLRAHKDEETWDAVVEKHKTN